MKDTLEFLSSFALEIISPADPDQLLKNALEKLLSGMDFRTGIIYILDDSGEQLILKVQCGIPNKIYKELKKRPANSDQTASEALSSGVPIVQRDFSRIDRIYKTLIKPEKPCYFIYIPVFSSDGAIGLIVFHGSDKREYTEDDKVMFKAVGRTLGQALKHSIIDEENRYRADELDLLQKINTSLTSAVNLDEVFQIIASGMVKVFGYTGSILFLDEEGKGESITLKAFAYNFEHKIIKNIEKLLNFTIIGHKFKHRIDSLSNLLYFKQRPVVTDNISDTLKELFNKKSLNKLAPAVAHLLPVTSIILVPLVTDGKVKGLLVVASNMELNQKDVNRVQAFASQADIAAEKYMNKIKETAHFAKQSAFQTILNSFSSSLDIKEILQNTTKQMVELFHVDHSGILTFDDANEWGEVVTEYPYKGAGSERIPLKGYTVAEKIIIDPQPIMIEDTMNDQFMDSVHDSIIVPLDIRSMLILPIVVKGKTIGSIGLDSIGKKRSFSSEEIEIAQTITGRVSAAIENARLFENLNEEKGRFELLYDISSRFTSDLELDKILERIIERITAELGAHIGYIYSIEPDGKHLKMQAIAGVDIPVSIINNKAQVSLDQGITGWVVRNRKPAVVSDVTKDSRWYYVDEIDHDVRAVISVPLFIREKVMGVVSVIHPQKGYFDKPEYLHLLTAVSNQVAEIMEKALINKQLKKSEERFRHVTANTGDWVWEVDAKEKIVYSSMVVSQILGYLPQEVLGRYIYDFSLPKDREKLKSEYHKIFQTKKPFNNFVDCLLHKDGHNVMMESSGIPLTDPDGKLSGYRGAGHDITARLQAEQALAASEYKYRVLIDNANNWIWTLDLMGNFSFFNRAAEKGSGYKSDDWLGKSFAPLIPCEELPVVKQIYSEALKGNSKTFELHVYNKDRKLITLAVNTTQLYNNEVITGTVSMGQDITRQKQLESQLLQSQKMEAIGTLAGGIAHDFNNILSGILGYTTLIKMNFISDNPPCAELDEVISLVKRASDLTQQLLAFARGGKYQMKPININDIINEILKMLKHTMDKAILIKPVLDPKLSTIEADAGQIQQMILNLCLNARDAMPDGGELLIETENVCFDEYSAENTLDIEADSYVFLSVSDTGIGMDNETKARIFDPFFTTKAGTGKNKHSGMGLSMIYGIVKNHKGIIRVYSEPGNGTNFKIYLPSSKLEIIKIEKKHPVTTGGEETILIVDDEDIILKPIVKMLGNAGYKVLSVNGGRKAVEIFEKQYKKIDLVILDMIMPDMNGRDTYNKLKEIDPEVKVLLSSGYSRNGQAQELINSGVKGFLQKPYEFEKILINVRQVLDMD